MRLRLKRLKTFKVLNMKKIILSTLFFLNISYICFAQSENRKNRIEAIQIAYLTKEISLTPDEAQKFWPVYNEYQDDLVAARKETRQDVVLFEEKVLNVRKKYKNDFKKVLGTDERVNKVFMAEKSFREMLRRELIERRGSRGRLSPDN